MSEDTVYSKLGDAVDHLSQQAKATDEHAKIWMKNFEELTGYKPNHPLNAFDVVKLMYKFYGEPTSDKL